MGIEQASGIAKLESEVRRLSKLAMEQQQTISEILLVCQRHNGPHVVTGAHSLAASIIAKINSARGGGS